MRDRARLFGVLGDPVDHSLSPAMHNAAFAAYRLPHVYLRYRVTPDELPAAFAEARRLGMGGLNLTVPLKETALGLVDAVTPEAERVGAVNTIVFGDDRVLGDNTDTGGFRLAVDGLVALAGARALVIGAGGSARAVGTALVSGGCETITIANRTVPRAEALARRLGALGGARVASVPLAALEDDRMLEGTALVVNTTSTGLAEETVPLRFGATPRQCLFVDLVYGPRPTPFLRLAARAHRRVLDGAAMLLHQGALAFEAWTGRPAPLPAMAAALASAGLALPRLGATATRGRA
jgi:shikimate dehydrogenase